MCYTCFLLGAMGVPEIKFVDKQLSKVSLARIPESRYKLSCTFCKTKMGGCIQCSQKKCYEAFHATCAKKAGLRLIFAQKRGAPQAITAANVNSLLMVVKCPKCTRKDIESKAQSDPSVLSTSSSSSSSNHSNKKKRHFPQNNSHKKRLKTDKKGASEIKTGSCASSVDSSPASSPAPTPEKPLNNQLEQQIPVVSIREQKKMQVVIEQFRKMEDQEKKKGKKSLAGDASAAPADLQLTRALNLSLTNQLTALQTENKDLKSQVNKQSKKNRKDKKMTSHDHLARAMELERTPTGRKALCKLLVDSASVFFVSFADRFLGVQGSSKSRAAVTGIDLLVQWGHSAAFGIEQEVDLRLTLLVLQALQRLMVYYKDQFVNPSKELLNFLTELYRNPPAENQEIKKAAEKILERVAPEIVTVEPSASIPATVPQ